MWYYGLVFSGYKKFFLEAGCAGSSDWIYSSIWDSEARIWEGINVVSEILILRGSFSIERQWGFNLEKLILFFFVYFKYIILFCSHAYLSPTSDLRSFILMWSENYSTLTAVIVILDLY